MKRSETHRDESERKNDVKDFYTTKSEAPLREKERKPKQMERYTIPMKQKTE